MAIALIAVGRETFTSATVARPAVFDMEEAVQFVIERLGDAAASRLTPEDLRWVLSVDVQLIESATDHAEDLSLGRGLLDEVAVVDVIMAKATAAERLIRRADMTSIISVRTQYLEAIGAIGPRAD